MKKKEKDKRKYPKSDNLYYDIEIEHINNHDLVCTPRIYWTYYNGFDDETVNQCPEYKSFVDKFDKYKDNFTGAGSKFFWNAFKVSTNIVIVDNYFDGNCYDKMISALIESKTMLDYVRKNIKIFISNDLDSRASLSNTVKLHNDVYGNMNEYARISFYVSIKMYLRLLFA